MIASPVGMAIAAMTVMLWIVWSDTLRARKPSVILYSMRILLFLVMSGLLVARVIERPWMFSTSAKGLTYVAAGVGLLGAGYFLRRIVTRVRSS